MPNNKSSQKKSRKATQTGILKDGGSLIIQVGSSPSALYMVDKSGDSKGTKDYNRLFIYDQRTKCECEDDPAIQAAVHSLVPELRFWPREDDLPPEDLPPRFVSIPLTDNQVAHVTLAGLDRLYQALCAMKPRHRKGSADDKAALLWAIELVTATLP